MKSRPTARFKAFNHAKGSHVVKLLAGITMLGVMATEARADYPETPHDFALLPPYCVVKLKKMSSPEYGMWAERIGTCFEDIHHYCAALHTLNQANRETDVGKKNRYYKNIIGDIEYVQTRSKGKGPCALAGQLAATKASVQMRLNLTK